ncbi:MAG TPA: isopentenyl phosphate kinase [Thermoplasmata archaeon]|jgi:isopentenyl phosphate kinase|nr:isopentenyl phosphate kinase [Thermoplasmata archaeon]
MASPAAPARPIVVVKLGGSVITRKREIERLRPKLLARLAAEVAEGGRSRSVVLLHGAGSFGHPGARRFGLARPPAPGSARAERVRGGAIVATEVRRLHLAVLRALVAAGTAPASLPMAGLARNRAGVLDALDTTPFVAALERALLPVSFGDVVPDLAWDASILSADTIALALVRAMPVGRVVFVSDVPGVLSGPAVGRRTVVPEITEATVAGLRPAPGVADVTGGIRGKAEAMRAIAAAGADAVLISGLTDGALARAIRGESVYGSWAHAGSR